MDTSDVRSNFIRDIIDADLAEGRHDQVVTRFPPEPNGYLHIGHAKSICLNFGLARDYQGRCHLRFDDTNPEKEEVEYVESIQNDIRWLGFDWGEHLYFASDYFEKMYDCAVTLVKKGLAYVDEQSVDEIRAGRGSFTEPGTNSPFRDRPVDENLDLLARMRAGEFPDGSMVLRARIDMAHKNMIMRDPLIYRIKHAHHHRTGDDWCIYPMYDFAHCLEDAIEGITHSICTLEFDNNREIYDWLLDNVDIDWKPRPRQYEFARLALDYTMMSKRNLRRLVEEGFVAGWDDPRMPTIAGLRRGGITPEAIRAFAEMVGVAKTNSTVDYGKLEFCIREDLNQRAPRMMAVLRPLRVVITDWTGDVEVDAPLWPHDVPNEGSRPLTLTGTVLIEQDDFAETPPEGWRRLAPGGAVRLRHHRVIRCDEVVRGDDGAVTELRCSLVADNDVPTNVGTIHWVSEAHAATATVRLYDRLFSHPQPLGDPEVSFIERLNPTSLVTFEDARVEPALALAAGGERFQFERIGYFYVDPADSADSKPVFNRTVTLKDSWARATSDEADLETLREERDREKAEQARRSAEGRRTPREVAEEGGEERLAAFDRVAALGVPAEHALALSATPGAAAFFAAIPDVANAPDIAATLIINTTLPTLGSAPIADLPYSAAELGKLVAALAAGTLSGSGAKRAHQHLWDTGSFDASAGAAVSDESVIGAAVDAVLADHPAEAQRLRDGETKLAGFFMGHVMRALKGKGDAAAVRSAILDRGAGA